MAVQQVPDGQVAVRQATMSTLMGLGRAMALSVRNPGNGANPQHHLRGKAVGNPKRSGHLIHLLARLALEHLHPQSHKH